MLIISGKLRVDPFDKNQVDFLKDLGQLSNALRVRINKINDEVFQSRAGYGDPCDYLIPSLPITELTPEDAIEYDAQILVD